MINPETMVTMKTKHFLGIVASAWMLASCSNQDELLQQDELVAKQCVTVNAYVPDDANSRLAFEDQGVNGLKVAWNESGESFSVMTAATAEPATFTQTEGCEFAGPEGFEFVGGTDYYAFYPALDPEMWGEWNENTEQKELNVSAKAIPFNFYDQTGQLDENMNLMYAKRSAEGDFQFQHMLAVMKFTLKGIQGKLVNTVDIVFYNESVEYFSDGKVNVTGESPDFEVEASPNLVCIPTDGLVSDGDGNYVVYAYLPPLAAGTDVEITAYSEDDGYYKTWRDEFTINNEGIKAGYYYTAARGMDANEEENVLLNHTAGNVEELKAWIDAVGTYPNVNLTLTADIALTGVAFDYDNDYNETNDSNWPSELMIAGTVDGGGHSITGIKIASGEEYQAAPFNIGSTGVVKNLHLKTVDISGIYAGGIASENEGIISGCSVSGSVTTLSSDYSVGGIVNDNSGLVTGCYNIAAVKGVDSYVGGIAGYNYGTITACYNTGALSATAPDEETYIGGVVGNNYDTGIITACYWNCTGATKGIGYDYTSENSSDEGATKVDSTTVTWETAMEAMNTALPSDFGDWRYEPSTNENEPLILDKSGNNDYVPV